MQEHQQPTALEDRLPQWNSFFWMCPWFLHVGVTVAGATAFKWLGKCLRAANLLCSTFNCLPCLCNCVSTFLLLPVLSQTRLKACLSSWVNLSLVYCWHWGRMGKIELCCFGEGCVSSYHMQIASAHTEFLLRTENTPRKIPPTPQNPQSSISPVCHSACCGAHRTAQECDAGRWHLHGVQFSVTYMEGVRERICSHAHFICSTHIINICPLHLDSSSLFSAIHVKTVS